jgi:electron transfer flavoprotein beta subunit
MRIVVCIKQIQDPEAAVLRVDEARREVIPLEGLQVTSPFDEQAIEAALRLRDKGTQCQITVVTFGPADAHRAIKRALSMGADDGMHVSNAGLERADSVASAHVLSRAITHIGQVDLVLTGRQAADWDAGIVGCGLAELLGIPVVTFAKSVQLEDGRLVIERVLDDGFETVEAALPCVVTISNELGAPRKASLRETMRAAKKPTQALTLEALGIGTTETMQERERLFMPVKSINCELASGASAEEIAKQLVARLAASKLL